MGYLPRVLFFNAFQLGTESENKVFPKDEGASKSIAGALRFTSLTLSLTLWFRENMTTSW